MTRPVALRAAGMRTGVGLDASSTCAAIRAAVDNFQESRFVGPDGEWIIASEVPLGEPWRGQSRLAHLLAGPLAECYAAAGDVPPNHIPLIVCTAELQRPGRLPDQDAPLVHHLEQLLDHEVHGEARVLAHGRVGAAVALLKAATLLFEEEAPFVIVAGVDTLLLARTLNVFAEMRRLQTPATKDGFIPGEAGSALLLAAAPQFGDMLLHRPGFAVEAAHIDSEQPLRAEGLVEAVRQALDHAGIGLHECDYRMTDISGAHYYFKEASLAMLRILRIMKAEFDIWHPADCIGEVGAAALPCMLGVALEAHRKRYAPGPAVLVHAGTDDGKRAALVMTGV